MRDYSLFLNASGANLRSCDLRPFWEPERAEIARSHLVQVFLGALLFLLYVFTDLTPAAFGCWCLVGEGLMPSPHDMSLPALKQFYFLFWMDRPEG